MLFCNSTSQWQIHGNCKDSEYPFETTKVFLKRINAKLVIIIVILVTFISSILKDKL